MFILENSDYHSEFSRINDPIELLTAEFIVQKMNYIHHNPVHEGIVFSPVDYVFSSATAYAGREVECPLDIDLLDVPLF